MISSRKLSSNYIDVSGYGSDNPYICPSDGYVYLLNMANDIGVLYFGYNSPDLAIGASGGAFTAIVYKGWKLRVSGTVNAARFYQFE